MALSFFLKVHAPDLRIMGRFFEVHVDVDFVIELDVNEFNGGSRFIWTYIMLS